MVRDRADRSSWSNHQFCNGDTVGKNLLPLLITLIGSEGKIFFGPFGRPLAVDDFAICAHWRYLHCFMLKMDFEYVSDKSR